MSASTYYPGANYPDWMPSMLVKELRQGMRTNAFVSLFVLSHVVMAAVFGLRLFVTREGDDTKALLDQSLWTAIALTLMLMMPMRGLNVIADESSGNTLELLQITNTSSLRVVWGKWVALASQTTLFVVAIPPYQVLYYFLGGVNVVYNLLGLAGMLGMSWLLTALCIVLSQSSILIRLAVLALAGLPSVALAGNFIESVSRGSDADLPGLEAGVLMIFYGLTGTFFLLAVAASRLNHCSENVTAVVRMTALFTALGAVLGCAFTSHHYEGGWLFASLPVVGWAGLEAMTEQASELPSTYLPWAGRRPAVAWIGRMLLPGWGSGLMFVSATTILLSIGGLFAASQTTEGAPFAMIHFGVTQAFPALFIVKFPNLKNPHLAYVLIQMACFAWLIVSSFGGLLNPSSAMTPLSAFIWSLFASRDSDKGDFMVGSTLGLTVDVFVVVGLLQFAKDEFRILRTGMKRAALTLGKIGVSEDPTPPISP